MKRHTIVIPFHNPWDWHTDYANQTALLLSKHHTVICFLWGDAVSLWELLQRRKTFTFITRSGNLWKIQPLFLIPGKRFQISQAINLILNAIAMEFFAFLFVLFTQKEGVFWFFGFYDPLFFLLPPLFRFWKTVYDCVDVPASPNAASTKRIQQGETQLLTYAYLVVANSHVLTKRLQKYRADVHTVPLGFRKEMFDHTKPYFLSGIKHPRILYIGSLDYRVDWRLLETIITKHPTYQFLLFGPVFYDHLSPTTIHQIHRVIQLPNVIHDHVATFYIPSLIAGSDIGIIPYDLQFGMSRLAYPMKIMEYFYGGKPVITTPIEELKRFHSLLQLATTPSDWSKALKFAVRTPLSTEKKQELKRIALQNTWEQKVTKIESLLLKPPSILRSYR